MVLANGDDHYGKEPILLAVEHALHGDADEHALVAFTLANTLGASGDVNRAVCETDGSEMLLSTEEVHGLHADPSGGATDATGRAWEAHRLVSMNLWVLRPSVLPLFRTLFQAGAYGPGGEFGLPAVVDAALERHHRFRVLPTKSAWCGLTYPDDAELVRRMLADRP